MTANENPAGQGGVSSENAGGAVSGVDDTGPQSVSTAGDTDAVYTKSASTISRQVCAEFLAKENLAALRDQSAERVADNLMGRINKAIRTQNDEVAEAAKLTKAGILPPAGKARLFGGKIDEFKRLGFVEVARLVAALSPVVRIKPSVGQTDPDQYMLAVYEDDQTSPHWGTYLASDDHLIKVARQYRQDLSTKEFIEVRSCLRGLAPEVTRGQNQDLVACRNGIVDYRGGDPVFMEFSPEHVFLAKLAVDWNPEASNTVIRNDADGTDWDVESWMADLDDDPEVVELLWQIIGATTRPYVSWNKAAFFYATSGNNGKGTLLSLMRNLLGADNYANIPLADFGKDFYLEPLTRASAILVDENDVGTFVDKAANFKAIVTNDVITINRKYKDPIAHQHFGFMVQCLNDRPEFKDRSDSIYRRQIFIPFTKCFTGAERKYIKDDYLRRTEVLEYVLKRVLTMGYYELSEPESVRTALDEFKEFNDPVLAFWNDVKYQFKWDLVPFTFNYDLYRGWSERFNPSGRPMSYRKFFDQLLAVAAADPAQLWLCEDHKRSHRPGASMAAAEQMIAVYGLADWMDPAAPAGDAKRRSTVPAARLKPSYRGFIRNENPPQIVPPVPDNVVAAVEIIEQREGGGAA